ncbi:cytochrome c nitrite reductase, NrfD subunit, partial [Vibrio parahaemolyticus V-223/04]
CMALNVRLYYSSCSF